MKIKIFLIVLFFYIMNLSAQDKLELFFDLNKDVINEKSSLDFDSWLKHSKDKEILKILAYCDSVDTNSYNKELSVRRASNVLSLLKLNNVQINENLELSSFGEDFLQSRVQNENRKVVVFFKTNIPVEIKIKNPKVSVIEGKINNSKVGDILKLENLNFLNLSDRLLPESKPVMLELLSVLIKNKNLIIEIQGHICCQTKEGKYDVSTARAKKVYDILIQNRIEKDRLSYKGFGSSKPIYSLPEKNEAERFVNRRVEILIVKK
jgi:outer membrane protein OmpA-like peptidoglycan-associated protein